MSASSLRCPECDAELSGGQTCLDYFHLMLAWEWDHNLYDLHHLMVASYHLQHPSLYSPEALSSLTVMLVEFFEQGVTFQAMRKRIGKSVDSGIRTYRIAGTPDAHGSYPSPVVWEMQAGDVIEAGVDRYYASIRQWTESILRSLRVSGNLA